jgi:hypothetical protein
VNFSRRKDIESFLLLGIGKRTEQMSAVGSLAKMFSALLICRSKSDASSYLVVTMIWRVLLV